MMLRFVKEIGIICKCTLSRKLGHEWAWNRGKALEGGDRGGTGGGGRVEDQVATALQYHVRVFDTVACRLV